MNQKQKIDRSEIDKLKIEVYNLRERLQAFYNETKAIQQEIERKVIEIRKMERG